MVWNNSVVIRPMTEQDAEVVVHLVQGKLQLGWSRERFIECIHARHYHVWVLSEGLYADGRGIKAAMVINVEGTRCVMHYLIVSAACQRTGVGSRLMRHLFAWVADYITHIQLKLPASNQTAIDFFTRWEFIQVDTIERYFSVGEQYEDALIFQLALT